MTLFYLHANQKYNIYIFINISNLKPKHISHYYNNQNKSDAACCQMSCIMRHSRDAAATTTKTAATTSRGAATTTAATKVCGWRQQQKPQQQHSHLSLTTTNTHTRTARLAQPTHTHTHTSVCGLLLAPATFATTTNNVLNFVAIWKRKQTNKKQQQLSKQFTITITTK